MFLRLTAAGAALALSTNALAAEGFQVRYNVAGSLGGEIFASPAVTGFAVGLAATNIDVEKVSGSHGGQLTLPLPGGTVALPAPANASLYPTYGANAAKVDTWGSFKLFNLVMGYVTTGVYGGGHWLVGVNLPYGIKKQSFVGTASTPALQWNAAVPQSTQEAVATAFGQQYQASVAGQAAAESGTVAGLGDLELQAGWVYSSGSLRTLAGASLVLPTGKYSAASGPDIGFGNFYTFRPAIQVGYLVTPDVAIGGKLTLGLNGRNKDNDLRSGDWLGIEAAAAWKTSVGALGLHAIYVDQYADDKHNDFGSARYETSNAGVFYTTRVPGLDAAMTLQFMRTLDSQYAKAGNFSQLRVVKVF